MRSFAIAVIVVILAASPALAQQSTNGSPSFGSAMCSPHVPCIDAAGSLTPDQYTANADACVTQHFGSPAEGSSFFDSTGPDSNGCLTLKPLDSTASANSKKPVMPHCCLVKLPDNMCAFDCELTR